MQQHLQCLRPAACSSEPRASMIGRGNTVCAAEARGFDMFRSAEMERRTASTCILRFETAKSVSRQESLDSAVEVGAAWWCSRPFSRQMDALFSI